MTTQTKQADSELADFLKRVAELLLAIRPWCEALGLTVQLGETRIEEERHGSYTAPTLLLRQPGGQHVAEVRPFGEAILGAIGRVDLVGEYGKREKLVYLSEGGPTFTTRIQDDSAGPAHESTRKLFHGVGAAGWYWVSPPPIRRASPITRDVFIDLLSAVSGHDFQP